MLHETEQSQGLQHHTAEITVLVIDDDRAVRRFLYTALSAYDYRVHEAATGQEGIFQIVTRQPDLILLDMDLPDTNGTEITRTVREWTTTPILILSALDQDTDKIAALDAGADDYIAKPFSLGELMARMRAALRRAQPLHNETMFSSSDLQVDLTARTVKVKDESISLTPTEYELLRVLVNHAGKVITHQQLWREIRSEIEETDSHLIRVHMSNLRHKLESDPTDPQYILTEPGVGYRLKVDL